MIKQNQVVNTHMGVKVNIPGNIHHGKKCKDYTGTPTSATNMDYNQFGSPVTIVGFEGSDQTYKY